MKKLICLLLTITVSLSSVLPCWAQDASPGAPRARSGSECEMQGASDSNHKTGTGGAFTIGLLSGFSLGLIGTGIAWACQGEPAPPAATVDALESAECRLLYRDAYRKTGRGMKRRSALIGGLVGTGALVALALSSGGTSE